MILTKFSVKKSCICILNFNIKKSCYQNHLIINTANKFKQILLLN